MQILTDTLTNTCVAARNVQTCLHWMSLQASSRLWWLWGCVRVGTLLRWPPLTGSLTAVSWKWTHNVSSHQQHSFLLSVHTSFIKSKSFPSFLIRWLVFSCVSESAMHTCPLSWAVLCISLVSSSSPWLKPHSIALQNTVLLLGSTQRLVTNPTRNYHNISPYIFNTIYFHTYCDCGKREREVVIRESECMLYLLVILKSKLLCVMWCLFECLCEKGDKYTQVTD